MKRKRRVRTSGDETGQGTAWLITFSDLATVLLAFFVLLVSMSTLDRNQLRWAFRSFETASKTGGPAPAGEGTSPQGIDAAMLDLAGSLKSLAPGGVRILDKISGSGGPGNGAEFPGSTEAAVWIRKGKGGEFFSVLLGSSFLFGQGEMAVSPGAHQVLEKIGDFIRRSDGMVFIDAHAAGNGIADDGAGFAPGQENAVSMAQSLAVLHFFLTQCNIDPGRMAMGAYGGLHPLTGSAGSPGAKMANGRVEIILEHVAQ